MQISKIVFQTNPKNLKEILQQGAYLRNDCHIICLASDRSGLHAQQTIRTLTCQLGASLQVHRD